MTEPHVDKYVTVLEGPIHSPYRGYESDKFLVKYHCCGVEKYISRGQLRRLLTRQSKRCLQCASEYRFKDFINKGAIEVLEIYADHGHRLQDKIYTVRYPCCNKEGQMTRQQIRRWRNGLVKSCSGCHTKRLKHLPTVEEQKFETDLDKFNKLMFEVNRKAESL